MQKSAHAVAEFLTVTICTLAFALTFLGICSLLLTGNTPSGRDIVSYWAAGQQLADHANPYDADAILRIERSAGFPGSSTALIMRNPPPALLFALPLGFIGLQTGALMWAVTLIACLIASVRMLWNMHGRPKDYLHFLGYTFGPALACVLAGQTSLFALLGIVLFLRLHRTRPILSGVSLWLCALKPHLFLPFGIVLLAWIIITKSYRVLVGFALALGGSCAIVFCFDPLAWAHYHRMMSTSGIGREFIPCLSVALRLGLDPDAIWLQYTPTILACVWAICYFWKQRDDWDWMEHGSLVLLVSILAAPYAWFTDQVLVIPALLQAAYLAPTRSLVAVLALVSASIEIELLLSVPMHSFLYLWTAPAWFVRYLWSIRVRADQLRKEHGPLSVVVAGAFTTTG
jgi:hypothetical protein